MRLFSAYRVPAVWMIAAGQASAGMTVITLTDIARARIDSRSFFLFTHLITSWGGEDLLNLPWIDID